MPTSNVREPSRTCQLPSPLLGALEERAGVISEQLHGQFFLLQSEVLGRRGKHGGSRAGGQKDK